MTSKEKIIDLCIKTMCPEKASVMGTFTGIKQLGECYAMLMSGMDFKYQYTLNGFHYIRIDWALYYIPTEEKLNE